MIYVVCIERESCREDSNHHSNSYCWSMFFINII